MVNTKINSSVGHLAGMAERHATHTIVVHHSATRRAQKCTIKDIDRWHRARGWDAVGYHFVIEKGGALRIGRPINAIGAHAYGHNQTSIGICVVGGLNEDNDVEENFDAGQYRTLQSLLIMLLNTYPMAEVRRHKDLAATKCSEVNIDILNETL